MAWDWLGRSPGELGLVPAVVKGVHLGAATSGVAVAVDVAAQQVLVLDVVQYLDIETKRRSLNGLGLEMEQKANISGRANEYEFRGLLRS